MFDLPDSDILQLSIEHDFWTWSAQKKVKPIPIKRAEGVYFWDINGILIIPPLIIGEEELLDGIKMIEEGL